MDDKQKLIRCGDGSEFDKAMRDYEFAAIKHGETNDHAMAVDEAAARLYGLFNSALGNPVHDDEDQTP